MIADRNRQGGGREEAVATISLISVSISTTPWKLQKKNKADWKSKNRLRPQRTDGAWAWCWERECLLGLGCQTDRWRHVAGSAGVCQAHCSWGWAGWAAFARAKFKSTKLFKRKEHLRTPDQP